MTTREPKQTVAVVCHDGNRCKGTHPLICRDHGCGILAARAAAAEKKERETNAERVRCSAWVGPQAWTVEKPRVSGMWWWWNLDPRCKPDMVEVRADEVLKWMGLGPTMHWPGLTRVRNVMVVGGVWAGPVEPPKLPDAQSAPTVRTQRAAGEDATQQD